MIIPILSVYLVIVKIFLNLEISLSNAN